MPLYNGNISQTVWSSKTDGHTKRKYSYEYDALNRLLEGHYSKPGLGSSNENYNERLGYDKNGNILWLRRLGDSDAPNFGNMIDDLAYSYAGGSNQLKKVMDATNDPSGFADDSDGITDAGDDYTYDSFGNMTSDENKGITSIRYNHLNLPTQINFADGNFILYKYNALGQKVYKRTREAGVFTTVDYLDGFQYQNGILQFFPTAEGYVRCTKVGTANFFNYVYQYKDHLGNIRMNFAVDPETGELKTLEESHYYPFGLKHMNYSGGKLEFKELNANVVLRAAAAPGNDAKPLPYNYKYNGKEWQDEMGLNVYDYGARIYDPAAPRFWQIDPVSENSRRFSPYSYALDNPVYFIDRDGMFADKLTTQNEGECCPGSPFGNAKSPKSTSPLGPTMQNFTPSVKTTKLMNEATELLSNAFDYEGSVSLGEGAGGSIKIGPVKVEAEGNIVEGSAKTNKENAVEVEVKGPSVKLAASYKESKTTASASTGSVKVAVDKNGKITPSTTGYKGSTNTTLGKDTKLSLSNSLILAASVKVPTPEGVSGKIGASVNLYDVGVGLGKMVQAGAGYVSDYISNVFSSN